MEVQKWIETAQPILVAFGLKVAGAIAAYIAGRWLINMATGFVSRALVRQQVDPTVIRYLASFVAVALNVVLVVAILGYFGVETTSFAALIAGVGVAVGAAWGGLLSNFAAGVFVVVLRPFKVGDYVDAGGVEGSVVEIGLFGTSLDTPDNVRTLVGNAKVLGANIKNYSHNAFRRVDLVAQLEGGTDHKRAIALLREALPGIPNVLASPAPDVEVLSFTEFGPVLAVRPYAHTDNYWQVYFDTNRLIREKFGEAGFAGVSRTLVVKNAA
jgi:small conductance mechanosensitive channel